jgi:hypothetical protein
VNFEIKETGYTDVTDADGEGSVDLNVGTYTVRAWMDRFMETEVQNVIIKKDETTFLELRMQVLENEV